MAHLASTRRPGGSFNFATFHGKSLDARSGVIRGIASPWHVLLKHRSWMRRKPRQMHTITPSFCFLPQHQPKQMEQPPEPSAHIGATPHMSNSTVTTSTSDTQPQTSIPCPKNNIINASPSQSKLSIRQRLKHFTFAWFLCTMSTGGLAIALVETPHKFRGMSCLFSLSFLL